MKKETQEMIARLRTNKERNMKDYEKQEQKAEKRINELEEVARENFQAVVELRKKHLKAK